MEDVAPFFDACDFAGSTPLPLGRGEVAPLSEFSDAARFDIGIAVQQPTPPPKWLHFRVAMIESRAWYEWHWFRGRDPDASRRRYRSLSKSLRRRIIERDGYVCGICSDVVDPGDVHIDHIIPRFHGGSDEDSNLRVTHAKCNLRKGKN